MKDARITAYLLNELSLEANKLFEERLSRDPEFAERVAMIEDELLDAYVSRDLPPERSARLAELYHGNDERREKLAFVAALGRRARK